MNTDREPKPSPSTIPILQGEVFEQLRRELNLDYFQSAVQSGEHPTNLIKGLTFDVFDKIVSLGGDSLYKHYLMN